MTGGEIKRLIIAIVALVLLSVAPRATWADMYQDASNASLPAALNNLYANPAGHTYYAQAYGDCTWDAAHDVGPCILAAVQAVLATTATTPAGALVGNAVVELPAGEFGLATNLLQNNKRAVTLRGAGGPGNGSVCGTQLKWIGAVGGTMAQFGDDVVSQTYGGGLVGLCLHGNDLAATGVKLRSGNFGLYEEVSVEDVTSVAWDLNPAAADQFGVAGNVFHKTNTLLNSAAAINATGWKFGPGSTLNDVWGNEWYGVAVTYQNGIAFDCGNADSNMLYGMRALLTGGGSGRSLLMRGHPTDPNNTCRGNRFWAKTQLGNSTPNSQPLADTDTFASFNNFVYVFTGGGALTPQIAGTATLSWQNEFGNYYSNAITHWQAGKLSYRPTGTVANNHAALDLDAANATNLTVAAKFGPDRPVYLLYDNPIIGLNQFWNGANWVYGKNSAGHHSARFGLNKATGDVKLFTSPAGNDGATAIGTNTWTVDKFGHVWASDAVAPGIACSGGGAGAVVAGDDRAGMMTIPTGNTACTMTFANAYAVAPFCTVSWRNNLASMVYTTTTSTIGITQTAPGAQARLDYHCTARSGG